MKVAYDIEKARLNPTKHDGVTFDEAAGVLKDPFALIQQALDPEGKLGYTALGQGSAGRILIVRWTHIDEETICITSAWKATRRRWKYYIKNIR